MAVNRTEYIHNLLLKYGKILKDGEYEADGNFHRIRIISRTGYLFYDHMINGEVVECHKLLPVEEDDHA